MAYCFTHPTTEAAADCADCKKPICVPCTTGTLDGFMCPGCAARRANRRGFATWIKVGAIALVLIAVAVFALIVVGRGNERTEGKDQKAEAAIEKDPYIESLKKQRDAAPCDRGAVRKLVVEYNEMKRHAEAVDDVAAYFKRCGNDFSRLKWDAIYALQQLGRYKEAIQYETELLTEDAFDSDFWWWRGEDRGHVGEHTLAIGDFRQSFASSDDAGGSRFAAGRILDSAVPAKKPCEAVFALDYFTAMHQGELRGNLTQKSEGLDTSEQCDTKRGKGQLELTGDKIKVAIGGVEGMFLVEPTCGTTLLTTAFAQKAQVAGRANIKIDTIAQGAIRSGPLATATLVLGGGKATAPETEVVIADGLPADVDGVLGLSALWKFDLERSDDGTLTITGTDK